MKDLGPGRSPGTQTSADAVPADHDDREEGSGDEGHPESDLTWGFLRFSAACGYGNPYGEHHEPGHDDEKLGCERDSVTRGNLHEADFASAMTIPGGVRHLMVVSRQLFSFKDYH